MALILHSAGWHSTKDPKTGRETQEKNGKATRRRRRGVKYYCHGVKVHFNHRKQIQGSCLFQNHCTVNPFQTFHWILPMVSTQIQRTSWTLYTEVSGQRDFSMKGKSVTSDFISKPVFQDICWKVSSLTFLTNHAIWQFQGCFCATEIFLCHSSDSSHLQNDYQRLYNKKYPRFAEYDTCGYASEH